MATLQLIPVMIRRLSSPSGQQAKGCFGEIGHAVTFDFGSLVAKGS